MSEKSDEKSVAGDPSQPLEKREHEVFCSLVANGMERYAAVQKAKRKRVKYDSARVIASVWQRRPEVRARLDWLTIQAQKEAQKPPEISTSKPANVSTHPPPTATRPSAAADTDTITRAELVAQLAYAVRNGSTAEIVQAGGALLKVMPELVGNDDATRIRPSPDAIVGYLATFAAAPLDAGAIMARCISLVGLDVARRSVATATRRLRPMRKSLTINAPPSDTQSDGSADQGGGGGEGAARPVQDAMRLSPGVS